MEGEPPRSDLFAPRPPLAFEPSEVHDPAPPPFDRTATRETPAISPDHPVFGTYAALHAADDTTDAADPEPVRSADGAGRGRWIAALVAVIALTAILAVVVRIAGGVDGWTTTSRVEGLAVDRSESDGRQWIAKATPTGDLTLELPPAGRMATRQVEGLPNGAVASVLSIDGPNDVVVTVVSQPAAVASADRTAALATALRATDPLMTIGEPVGDGDLTILDGTANAPTGWVAAEAIATPSGFHVVSVRAPGPSPDAEATYRRVISSVQPMGQ